MAFVCVSVDDSAEPVKKFLADKSWPMTMLHAGAEPLPLRLSFRRRSLHVPDRSRRRDRHGGIRTHGLEQSEDRRTPRKTRERRQGDALSGRRDAAADRSLRRGELDAERRRAGDVLDDQTAPTEVAEEFGDEVEFAFGLLFVVPLVTHVLLDDAVLVEREKLRHGRAVGGGHERFAASRRARLRLKRLHQSPREADAGTDDKVISTFTTEGVKL